MTQLTVQLPDPVLDAVRKLADREKVTVEEFVSQIVADMVRLDAEWGRRAERGRQVSRQRFLEILHKAPDTPPAPGDEIE
jgi:hypothetical protein